MVLRLTIIANNVWPGLGAPWSDLFEPEFYSAELLQELRSLKGLRLTFENVETAIMTTIHIRTRWLSQIGQLTPQTWQANYSARP